MLLTKGWKSLLHLFYPQLCFACEQRQPIVDRLLCANCEYELPLTEHWLQPENAFTKKFWGRLPLENGAALYQFSSAGRVQHLIHQLKYRYKPQIGEELGKLLGNYLAQQATYANIDAVVPVPLHPKKEHQRGYNQAAAFGKGVALALGVPQWSTILQRTVHRDSQTTLSRAERLLNVTSTYALSDRQRIADKHILLVDDVLTTGATLEACAQQLLQVEGVKVSMATIALAE